MLAVSKALSAVPAGLRTPLLSEYDSLVTNYSEQKWTAAELSGGKFCEIVYTILDGYAKTAYAAKPSKPENFIEACRRLESNSSVPRSFQILIPRLLPPLYEIRNNRNVGHVGGDVDPNHMDATTVLAGGIRAHPRRSAQLHRLLHDLSGPAGHRRPLLHTHPAEFRRPAIRQHFRWHDDESPRAGADHDRGQLYRADLLVDGRERPLRPFHRLAPHIGRASC